MTLILFVYSEVSQDVRLTALVGNVCHKEDKTMAFFTNFKRSAEELKNVRCIVTVGVLLAVAVVLDGFGSIRIGDYLKINFTFLPLSMIGILFGPVCGGLAGLLVDIIGYIINPIGSFIPALVLISGLEGLLYGMILYDLSAERAFKTVIRVVTARFFVCLICNLTLNTIALYSYGFIPGESLGAVMYARIAVNVITFVLGSYMMMAVLVPMKQFYDRKIRVVRPAEKGTET